MRSEMIYICFAAFSYSCLVIGLFYRKNRQRHFKWMLMGIGVDVLIVVILELRRSVIVATMTEPFSFYQQVHILTSTIATILYFPIIVMGLYLLRGKGAVKMQMLHRICGVAAFSFRSFGFLTMFSMLSRQSVNTITSNL